MTHDGPDVNMAERSDCAPADAGGGLTHVDDAQLITFVRTLAKNRRDKIPGALRAYSAPKSGCGNPATALPQVGGTAW